MISQKDWQSELEGRRSRVWAIIEGAGAEVGIVYGSADQPGNFRYLTNFAPTMGEMWAIVSGPTSMKCVLNFQWELVGARQRSGINDWVGEFDTVPAVVAALEARGSKRVAVVGLERMPALAYQAIRSSLPDTTFLDIGCDFTKLRRYKSNLELELLREAVRRTDEVMEAVRSELRPGMTEHELAARILYDFHSRGTIELAFTPLVMSGNDDPVLVRDPTDRKLQTGDSVMIDIGGTYEGYQADVTRTFVLGEPNPEQRRAWDTILQAHSAVLKRARPGVTCSTLHEAAVEIMQGAGYHLPHRIGHGIGLATSFEWPSLDTESGSLEPGMTIAIEPGVYRHGVGSMKLEDSLVITEDGNEVLSKCSTALEV
jgi:Xaa-Pro aminopeptidase